MELAALEEVSTHGRMSSLANQGRAALKQILSGIRQAKDVTQLLTNGISACDLVQQSAEADASREVDLSQLKAYDAYQPLRDKRKSPDQVKDAVVRTRKVLEDVLRGERVSTEAAEEAVRFLAEIAAPYQEAAWRALGRSGDETEPVR